MTFTETFGPTADSMIRGADVTSNFGTSETLIIGYTGGMRFDRALLRFDISSLPSDTAVSSSSTLDLTLTDIPIPEAGISFILKRVTKSWVENEVTYVVYATGSSWDTSGGDSAAFTSGTPTVTTPASAPSTMTFTGKEFARAVQDAIINRAGILDIWLLKGNETSNISSHVFASRENTTEANRPLLTVNYARRSMGRNEARNDLASTSAQSHGLVPGSVKHHSIEDDS